MSVEQYLSKQGQLATKIKDFTYRPQQLKMAEAVERTMQDGDKLVVEAGTGVGKTFAYLVPAILSGMKVIVSTGTRHLQDQLFYSDLPVLQQAIALPVNAAILKGRANYLCHYRFKQFEHELPDHPALNDDYIEISDWSRLTNTGDIAEVNQLSEQSPIWGHVTSTRDNCLGGDCPDFKQCHVLKARKQAQEASLVVINHHLLCADLVLKEEGFGELLPTADVFILDEAHQLSDVLPNFFGLHLSSRQLQDLVGDISKESSHYADNAASISKSNYAVLDAVERFYSALATRVDDTRLPWDEVSKDKKADQAFEKLKGCLFELNEKLINVAGESPGLAVCYKRVNDINGILDDFSMRGRKAVQWVELGRRRFLLGSVPLNVAAPFQKSISDYQCAWIYTSATLTAKQSFDHFTNELGLDDAECVMCDSPFDYKQQSRLYLPDLTVLPNEKNYTDEVVKAALPLLRASHGNAFLLFTSHRALNRAADLLKNKRSFKLLVQGSAAKRELLKSFRENKNSVLLGTQSFWEGVDVKGQQLRLVIIDKLPFASPADPVLQAKMRALEEAGEKPFMSYQVPQAILSLKQGVGRLIRDEQDRGVVVLMDPRVKTKSYGKSFIKSLPPMTISSDEQAIVAFLENIQANENTRH